MTDYESQTVVELKKLLKTRGLELTGKKADLVQRLKDDDGDAGTKKETTKKTTTTTAKGKGKRAAKEEDEDDDGDDDEEEAPKKKPKKEEVEDDSKGSRSSGRVKAKKEEDAKKEASVGKWANDGSLYYLDSSAIPGNKRIASFDMDDAIIETKSGKTFATSRTDWQWLHPKVPEKLKALNKDGVYAFFACKVIIFTNQGGIDGKNGFDKSKLNQIEGKIEDISEELGFAIQAFIATTEDQYRKPSTAMWDFMVKNCNGGIKPDLENSIFVGDAAGRAAGWAPGRKKDFSCSDRKFAKNIGVKFSTPEEYFLNEASAEFEWGSVELTGVAKAGDGAEITEGGIKTLTTSGQEIVLFVGFPASGKSTLARKYMVPAGYVHVNRDTLKTKEKCLKVASAAVNDGKSVVIDNTNPDPSTRAEYIALAKRAKIPIRCFRFDVEEQLANHLNYFRERLGISKHVPRIGYAVYKKGFREPELDEGFSEIKKIKFVASFDDPEHEKLFQQQA